MHTRDLIIYESLKLFSTNGYDAVSTRMIARAVGVSDTALYKHFRSKQEIFDTVILQCKERFKKQQDKMNIPDINWKDVKQLCMRMVQFQTEDEWIVMFHRLLVIEQFKNPEMEKLYQSIFIQGPMDSMIEIFAELMEAGYMKKQNPKVLAMELYAPFYMYHLAPQKDEMVLKELQEHVTYFCGNNICMDTQQSNN